MYQITKLSIVGFELTMTSRISTVSYNAAIENSNHQIYVYGIKINQEIQIVDVETTDFYELDW